jgi:hypothetical protein
MILPEEGELAETRAALSQSLRDPPRVLAGRLLGPPPSRSLYGLELVLRFGDD